jgi:hypothetical protein
MVVMSTTPRATSRPTSRPALALAAAASLAVTACGGGAGAEPSLAPSTVYVTLEPSVSASAEPSAEPSTQAAPSASAEPSGDPAALPKQERGYDVVYIGERRDTPDGVVLTFDRLTVNGVDDATLAANGAPVTVDDGSKFTNQAERFYEVGVSPDARFFLTTCTATDAGPSISSEPVELDAFLAAPSLPGTAVSFEYGEGLLVRGETNPRC